MLRDKEKILFRIRERIRHSTYLSPKRVTSLASYVTGLEVAPCSINVEMVAGRFIGPDPSPALLIIFSCLSILRYAHEPVNYAILYASFFYPFYFYA